MDGSRLQSVVEVRVLPCLCRCVGFSYPELQPIVGQLDTMTQFYIYLPFISARNLVRTCSV